MAKFKVEYEIEYPIPEDMTPEQFIDKIMSDDPYTHVIDGYTDCVVKDEEGKILWEDHS